MFNDGGYTYEQVERLRDRATPGSPPQIPSHMRDTLSSVAFHAHDPPPRGASVVLRLLCANRDAFLRCALIDPSAEQSVAYVFLYAGQSP